MSLEQAPLPLGPSSWAIDAGPDPLAARQGLIGAPLARRDGPAKVTGEARYASEVRLDGMLYGALAFSTIPRGRIVAMDTSSAERAAGVALVMTHHNAPRLHSTVELGTAERAAAADELPVMQDDRIRWNGQPIAIVLAESQEQADHAASLIDATYQPEPAITRFDQARADARPPALYQGDPLRQTIGDPWTALAESPHTVDAVYTTPRHHHNAIEPHAVTLAWDGDELTVHDCPQAVTHLAWSLAQVFGIRQDQVHISAPYVGGGFGGKMLWQHQILAAAAARLSGRPVRVVLSREGVYRVVGGRTSTEQRVAIGAEDDGTFTSLVHTGVVATSRHNNVPEPFIKPARCLYATRNATFEVKRADLDMLANTFMRAPGEAVGTFALESAVDELADRMGVDPIELRLCNEPAVDPSSGKPFSARHLIEAYRAGAERFGWEARSPRPRARRDGEWLIGLGCATATYPYNRFPGGAARITINRNGDATVEVAAHEMGMGTGTVQSQVAAERLGLPVEKIIFVLGDSSLPGVVLAGGSQQTAAIGGAITAAHRELVGELLKLINCDSPLAGLHPDEVGTIPGGLGRLDDPSRSESYTAILAAAGVDTISAEATAPEGMEQLEWSMHSYGAQFCEVRVSVITGEIRVSRFLGSFDCGRIINARTAASQLRGGIVMGLGLALMEETQVDGRSGRIMNPSLADYHVPAHADVPDIEVMWTDIPDPHTPLGAHGVGEIGITGTAAAVANAVYNAIGVRVRDPPITPDKLLRHSPGR
ncbi:xanthine dehydrogenase family protein molybdopterin-binding subunit [Pseudonocardia kujensis]|uniref:xanthine dehydrogenase family protein molybdopterin-binding subunit n=1 Tax=Pseudonocardia kujensis TaxID=1128675 RepID=UPI001E3CC1D1|nr:xanthine dehydrogenase family protein molybdopterin-binding subunit [Pseudonocardia kujensis]MCE0766874.1 xanthine dehydrogenase family protein molybdopterin-binding subunit [Pseudonocardia kujensis]